MRLRQMIGVGAAALACNAGIAVGKPAEPATPPRAYSELMACRDIQESAARLTCYDRYAKALDDATKSRDVIIADREAVTTARRGLFGFTAPVGRLLGFGGDDDAEPIKEIESTIIRVGHASDGGWRIALEDGSTWEQNDTRTFVLSPKTGNAVKITKGALGSYVVSIQGQRGIKMRRVQ